MSYSRKLSERDIATYPGKTIGGQFHPALWHMLDVGAVATRLMDRHTLTGRPDHDAALGLLIALHDLGKISDAFQKQITGEAAPAARHAQLSFVLFERHDGLLASYLGGDATMRRALYAAAAGHHGGPPELDAGRGRETRKWLRAVGSDADKVSAAMICAVAELFPQASLNELVDAEALSWRVSGLTVQADWIGSNAAWFGVEKPDIGVDNYWNLALVKADAALLKAGLNFPKIQRAPCLLPAGGFPRPMQKVAMDVDLPNGPMLALIEDATGAGKTEAALMLSVRMMAAKKGNGLFLALPTMATSNAMFARIADAAPKLFDGVFALGLSHGRAHVSEIFTTVRGNDGSDPNEPVTCGQWLAEDRRKLLLADVGVGTVDQALMSVLPTRFHTLRQWALSQKILIIDEAHSYDPFMEEELCRLLWFHAMLGGSAIVMTATLPQRMRLAFATAFQRGLNKEPQIVSGKAYPLLTIVGESIQQKTPKPVPATCRRLEVRRILPEQATDILRFGVDQGAACLWVRNAVDDAISATRDLRAQGIPADLLHARFTVSDRLARENVLQARFGRDGNDRAGKVIVATQVVEASLDLDFDVIVTDLAPIGALIQRAGRLWRHMDLRPQALRPVTVPRLHVVSPDPCVVEDARWLHRVLGAGAFVYSLADQWRTAHALFDAGEIDAPNGVRALIEAVHGGSAGPLPKVLEQAELERLGSVAIERQMAHNQLLTPTSYLEAGQKVYDEDRLMTRLGIPQVTLWLARRGRGGLVPYADTWEASEVRMSRKRYEALSGVDQGQPQIAALKARWPEWRRGLVEICPVADDGELCEGLRYDEEMGLLVSPAERV